MGSQENDKRRLESVDKRTEVVRLRTLKLSYRQIQERTGVDVKTAHRWVGEAMRVPEDEAAVARVIEAESQSEREQKYRDIAARAEENERNAVMNGEFEVAASFQRNQVQALAAAEKVSEARRKMFGLDAPQRVENVNVEATANSPADAKRIMSEIFGAVGPKAEEKASE
jgi:hypothetical protein